MAGIDGVGPGITEIENAYTVADKRKTNAAIPMIASIIALLYFKL